MGLRTACLIQPLRPWKRHLETTTLLLVRSLRKARRPSNPLKQCPCLWAAKRSPVTEGPVAHLAGNGATLKGGRCSHPHLCAVLAPLPQVSTAAGSAAASSPAPAPQGAGLQKGAHGRKPEPASRGQGGGGPERARAKEKIRPGGQDQCSEVGLAKWEAPQGFRTPGLKTSLSSAGSNTHQPQKGRREAAPSSNVQATGAQRWSQCCLLNV